MKTFALEDLKQNGPTVFIMYQLGFYAMDQANDWKVRILKRWPHVESRIHTVEVCEKNFAYSLLRKVTGGMVSRRWGRDLVADTTEARLARQLFLKENSANRSLLTAFKKATGLAENKYLVFVYAVDRKGMVSFKACGIPNDQEMNTMAPAMESKQ